MSATNTKHSSARGIGWLSFPLLLLGGVIGSVGAQAQTPPADDELLRQRERDRALQERQETVPDVRLSVPLETVGRFPDQESPCFVIDTLAWQGEDLQRFPWLDAAVAGDGADDTPIGRCLGTQGVNLVVQRAQNALIERGFVTSRVLVEPQDLSDGTLTLTLLPGRIASLRVADPDRPHASLRNAVPARPGDILNLRDIEQALENFQSLPSVDVDIQIAPADEPGSSDLVIDYAQGFPLRPGWSLDNGGSDATGRYLNGVTVAYDNPLGINDLFYAYLGKDLGGGDSGRRGNKSRTLHYAVPWGYWRLAATASDHDYHQTVVGAFEDYVYSGTSRTLRAGLSRVIHRDASRKTSFDLAGFQRQSRNYIDDLEIEVQRRNVGGWEAGVAHREFLGRAVLDLGLGYQRGTGAFGARPAPEEPFGDGTSRFQIVTSNADLDLPFQLGEQRLHYRGHWRMQRNLTPLSPLERFSIGSRYTVRGFHDTSLSAERGWLVRNELEAPLGNSAQRLYAALDHGHVGGPSTEWLLGTQLTGAAVGLRGALLRHLHYDVFVATPVKKPDGFRSDGHDVGLSVNLVF
ncbi:ShlB/FhaC/HecB family hemolysin secretion/activation protein [Billgrantia endophytica]|uniref:ShlB/FhaC/HecB family hemolysin secretion/activation protein n=1 Tax=Billgrantia endophytica TaxID=2033802 RepID=UPI00197AE3EF|nr:ShlB/FhaC/HecB family hemolysin secretion/activation protein [Halomonas endophytica]